jgi:hypothetical protein
MIDRFFNPFVSKYTLQALPTAWWGENIPETQTHFCPFDRELTFPPTVNGFVMKKYLSRVSNTLTTARNKLIAIARSNVMLTYNLYPQEGSKEPPDAYRVRIVAALIGEHPRKLLFMYKYTIFLA